MNIKEAQGLIRRIYFERNKQRGVERTLLRTYQELGELTDAIMKEKAQADIEDELADVFAWVISIANLLDMELGSALLKRYSNAYSKCGSLPCKSADTR